jgi:CMP-N-acetylneuraminic acid synthetase
MRNKITALVPIRVGSQRVKDKNFRPFANTTLLKLKLEILTQVDTIDEIVVNTNSDEAIQIAKDYGVSYFRREEYYASSECTNTEHWENLAETTDTDYIIHTPCTAPLVKVKTYYDFINRFNNSIDMGYDSCNSVSSVKEFLWLDNKPLNYDLDFVPNSQDLPDIYNLTFGISIIGKDDMLKYKNVVGKKPHFYVLDEIESVDIDNQIDFDFAEFLYSRCKNEI